MGMILKFQFFLLWCCFLVKAQFFPLDQKGQIPEDIVPFKKGDKVFFECISREIMHGEHNFNDKGKIVYAPFPTCMETKQPLSVKYGIDEDFNCTIGFSDELYHLFQMYIHEDVPFSCRVPLSNEAHYTEKGGASVPITMNFRGEFHDSHLDIDNGMNMMLTVPWSRNEPGTIVNGAAWGSSTNTTRIVINDFLTIRFAVRWNDFLEREGSQTSGLQNALPFGDGFYKLARETIPMSNLAFWNYILYTFVFTLTVTAGVTWKLTTKYNRYSFKRWNQPYDNIKDA